MAALVAGSQAVAAKHLGEIVTRLRPCNEAEAGCDPEAESTRLRNAINPRGPQAAMIPENYVQRVHADSRSQGYRPA